MEETACFCPACGLVLGGIDDIYFRAKSQEVVGCTECITAKNAQDWAAEAGQAYER